MTRKGIAMFITNALLYVPVFLLLLIKELIIRAFEIIMTFYHWWVRDGK